MKNMNTQTKNRYSLFIENFIQDAILFFFFLFLISVYRGGFLLIFQNTLEANTSVQDIFLTFWYGLRISLKSAGALFLPAFFLGTLLQQIFPKWNAFKFRFIWACIAILVLSLLFQARIPYYHEFNTAFSPFIFNTFHDDVFAITNTAITQYEAVWRVLLGSILGLFFCFLCNYCLKLSSRLIVPFQKVRRKWVVVLTICILLIPTALLVRFGGSFNYKNSIYWKNAARMDQLLLNEAILDDIQALYRAKHIYKRFQKYSKNLKVEDVRQAAARLLGKEYFAEDSLLPVFLRTATGNNIKKPRHIFVFVAETYMLWPLLNEYKNLPISAGLQSIINQPNTLYLPSFLPAGDGTMFGVTSILLGMPELNLLTANRPEAQKPYETALSVQLKKQGYKTRFFYGGFPSWENIGPFMNNQQMDESFYYADFGGKGSVWGVPDKPFLEGVFKKIDDQPSFNFILTSTNHPPFILDMTKEAGITSEKKLEKFLSADTADKNLMIQRLQHFEYADKYLTQFVQQIQQKYPDSLIIITGDHASRWKLTANPSWQEHLAVPLVITGKGISPNMLPSDAAGSHMDIPATVLDLILPRGTPYYAMGDSVLNKQKLALHSYYWGNANGIGELGGTQFQFLSGKESPIPPPAEQTYIRQHLKDIQTVSAWRILNGTSLKEN